MVSSSYRITEPHPSVPSSHYIHSGRGGAGNVSHIDPRTVTSGTDATGPASRASIGASAPISTNPYYTSGRGGAGNMHYTQERPMFSFDEELERQRKMMEHQAPVYHIGRGGAGNLASEVGPRRLSERSDASSEAASSAHSVRHSMEGAWTRLRGSFSKPQ
jgi:hypothetical protein